MSLERHVASRSASGVCVREDLALVGGRKAAGGCSRQQVVPRSRPQVTQAQSLTYTKSRAGVGDARGKGDGGDAEAGEERVSESRRHDTTQHARRLLQLRRSNVSAISAVKGKPSASPLLSLPLPLSSHSVADEIPRLTVLLWP